MALCGFEARQSELEKVEDPALFDSLSKKLFEDAINEVKSIKKEIVAGKASNEEREQKFCSQLVEIQKLVDQISRFKSGIHRGLSQDASTESIDAKLIIFNTPAKDVWLLTFEA